MKRVFISLVAAAAFPALALAQSPPENTAAQKKMEQQVPEMKNPSGTDKLHPPQKAMDEATPAKPDGAGSGASAGEAGTSKTWSAKEGETTNDAAPKSKY
jgi:hypothetical protein